MNCIMYNCTYDMIYKYFDNSTINIDESWLPFFERADVKSSIYTACMTLRNRNNRYHPRRFFGIFERIKISDIRVLIVGLEPYSSEDDATDIAFELDQDLDIDRYMDGDIVKGKSLYVIMRAINKRGIQSGNLSHWIRQGVFLINSSLTYDTSGISDGNNVDKDTWAPFITLLFGFLSNIDGLIVVLFGQYPRSKFKHIFTNKMCHVICPSHPSSVINVDKEWQNTNPFVIINKILTPEIQW